MTNGKSAATKRKACIFGKSQSAGEFSATHIFQFAVAWRDES
jgi:hypothetical protein